MEPDQALGPRRRGPKLPPLGLTDQERATLQRWARRQTSSQALAERCRIVLACAEGASNREVADRLGVSRPTVTKWRSRFVARRLDGLADEPRPGAPRQITDEQVERVIVMTLEQAPTDATHWSTRSLARTLGMSQTSISRIWRAFGLKPHLTEAFKLSTDPQFIDKVRDVVGLYLNPPEAALVLCVDEKTRVQALDRTAPILPVLPGTPQRAAHDSTRHGTTNLYAALEVASGKVISQLTARHRAIEFKRFLAQLDRSVPADLGVHVIGDNSSTHKTPAVQRWLLAHPRVHLHFTPTYSSWLNLVERWFAELTTKWLGRGSHQSVADLEQAIQAWIETWNADPRPFVWTKTADEILDTIATYCQRINNQDTSSAPARHTGADMADQVTAGQFVGRAQELARLRQLLARAADGEPLVALLGGEAGVGKTRLVEQLAAGAQGQGVRVMSGGCVPLGEEGLPFAPVIQALRGLADQLDPAELQAVAGPARQELARLLPDLAWGGEAATAGAGATGAGQVGQGRLFALLLGVVERLAAHAPLLWVVEDLHWADRSTRDLLAYLATTLRSGRVMVVLTFRSDELHRLHPLWGLLGELGRNRRVQRLELPPFTRAELAERLAGLLGVDPPGRLVDDVYARSEGNPFFAEELVLAGGDPAVLPPSLREVLKTRVVRLGDRTQQLLRVAAAAGPGVTQPLLAAVTGMDDQQLLECLREAVDQQLLLPEPGGGGGYVFRHALLAEAVYAELLPGERVRLHTALARALEAGLEAGEAPASRAARLAYHWAAAGDQPRALTASVQAAEAAERVHAFAEAQLQLERALVLWDQVPDAQSRAGTDRAALLARCAEAAYGAGDPAGAAELVRQALGRVDAARQPRWAGLLHEQLARCLRLLADPKALGEQREAVRLVPPGPSVERARVLGSLAQQLVLVNRFAEARGLAEEAVAIAGQVGARAEEANARTALGSALGYLGDPDAGLAELEAARRLAMQAGDVIVALRAITSRSDGLLAAGRPEEAVAVALDGLEEARRLGPTRFFRPVLAANATEALLALGRWYQAEQVSREGLETSPSGPAYKALPLARAALELGLGDLDAAQARLQAVRRLLPAPIPESLRTGPLFGGLVELALWRSDLDQARQLVAQALPLVAANPRQAAPIYALGVRVEADRAELARARHPGQPAPDDATAAALLARLDQAAQGPAAAGLPELLAWQATAVAERTRQQGSSDPAAWAAAVAAWERLGQPYRVAYACFRHAEALLATGGDRDSAAQVLRRAAEVTGRLGARPLDAEIRALARRARLDLTPPASATAAAAGVPAPAAQLGLTPREVEVLALVAAGRSNRQIAQAMFISPKTVGVHVSNILAKLGAAGRVEAAAVAHRLGLD